MVGVPRRHLQADSGGRGQRPGAKRRLTGLGQPVNRTTADQVDRAQLVQCPDALEGEMVLFSNRKGSGERLLG